MALLVIVAASGSLPPPTNLQIEHRGPGHALGIDAAAPRLWWSVAQPADGRRRLAQAAYELEVQAAAQLWTGPRVASTKTEGVALGARASGGAYQLELKDVARTKLKGDDGAAASPWTPLQLQQKINASIAAGAASLAMPAGDYFFDGSLVIAGASGFELRVAGGVAKLWFVIGHGLLVDACSNVAVSGPFELDYVRGAHFQGTVVNATKSSLFVRTEKGWLDPDEFMAKDGHLTTSESTAGVRWTKASGLKKYVGDSTVQNGKPEKVGPGLFRYHKSAAADGVPAPVAGDKLAVRIRAGYTLHAQNSSRVVYSDIKIHGATFMAITEFGGKGGHRYKNVKVARRSGAAAMCAGGKRSCAGLIASNADAFHSSACRDGPHLSNVDLSYCLDDFINVHTRVQAVGLRRPPATDGGGERLVLLDPRLSRDAGLPNDAPYGTAETLQNLRPGDNVSFYQLNTLTKLATRTVASATRFSDVAAGARVGQNFNSTVNLPPHHANPHVNDCDVCGLPPTLVNGNQKRSKVAENCPAGYSRAWHVELAAGQAPLPPSVTNNTLVQIEGWDASGAVVENCHFHDSDYGFRWKSSNSRIINSVIGGNRMEISPLQFYLEGALEVHDVQISGNTFTELEAMSVPNESGCTGSKSSYAPATCSGIVLTNNTFKKAAVAASTAPTLLWKVGAGANGTKSDPVLSSDLGSLYIGLNDGRVVSFNATTGAILWSFQTGAEVFAGPTLSHDGSLLFIGSGDSYEYCLVASSGARVWASMTNGSVFSNPSLTPDGSTVYTGSADGHVYAFDSKSGALQWQTASPFPQPVASASVISPDGSTLYCGCHNGVIYAIDTAARGRIVWQHATGAEVQSDQVLSSDGRVLYIGSDTGNVYALTASNGSVLWKSATSGKVRSGLTLNADESTLFFGSFGGKIWSLDAASGMTRWSLMTKGAVGSKPALAASETLLFQGSFDGSMYAVEAATGKKLWAWPTGGEIHSDPAVDEERRVIYGATYAGFMFALQY